jgi:UDP-N-acetylmuramate--alanine ligase
MHAMKMPTDIGPFHIIGIGGIGMSAIAEIMLARGYDVQGSDISDNANTQRLQTKGARIFSGHAPENIGNAQYVVISTAVKPGNPELDTARILGLPIISRAEMLAELMRSYDTVSVTGTHGKTTTSSIIAELLKHADIDPTVITGGIINSWKSNAHAGTGNWMVVEADESDATFIKLPTRIGVVTNIDPEHMDHYGSLDMMHEAFGTFFRSIPFYGKAIAGIDHPVVRRIIGEVTEKPVLTYGSSVDADLRLVNFQPHAKSSEFDIRIGDRIIEKITVPVPGRYNALNALAAIGVALEVGIDVDKIRAGIAAFSGVGRRFTHVGAWNNVDIYDDYAHHPVEISAVIKAARHTTKGQLIAVKQPHRYSRLASLFDDFCSCFGEADKVIVLPVFAAGDEPVANIDHKRLAHGINGLSPNKAIAISGNEDLPGSIANIARPGDCVICLGAGSISRLAHALPDTLASLESVI